MPRKARVVLTNCPHHVMQRGHNRQAIFTEQNDYHNYIGNLKEWKEKLGCRVYAYCLMTNHAHLVIDPGDSAENLGLLMKRVSGRQTRLVNQLEGRTGSLWEGRYKSSPIDTDKYLLSCCRYVELNPVRAGMVELAEQYQWSSYRSKTGREENDWLDLDPCYLGLGSTSEQRVQRYEDWVNASITPGEIRLLREALQRGQLTGDDRFSEEVERRIGIRVKLRKQGRPMKALEIEG